MQLKRNSKSNKNKHNLLNVKNKFYTVKIFYTLQKYSVKEQKNIIYENLLDG